MLEFHEAHFFYTFINCIFLTFLVVKKKSFLKWKTKICDPLTQANVPSLS